MHCQMSIRTSAAVWFKLTPSQTHSSVGLRLGPGSREPQGSSLDEHLSTSTIATISSTTVEFSVGKHIPCMYM